MPYTLYAECPCCGKRADSLNEIEANFGWRIMDAGKKIPQSYCRDCRKARCEAGKPCKVKKNY